MKRLRRRSVIIEHAMGLLDDLQAHMDAVIGSRIPMTDAAYRQLDRFAEIAAGSIEQTMRHMGNFIDYYHVVTRPSPGPPTPRQRANLYTLRPRKPRGR